MIYASFDLDGVLLNSLPIILDALSNQGYPVDLSKRGGFFFDFEDGKAPPEDFLWDVFFYRLFTERWEELTPVDDNVVEFIQDVHERSGSPVHIITSRPKGAFMHHCTMLSLKKNFPGVDFSVDIVGSSSEKPRWMFGTDIIFEDRRRTAINMSRIGYIVFLINRDYNRLEDSVHSKDIKNLHHLGGEIKSGDIITFDNYNDLMSGHDVADYIIA